MNTLKSGTTIVVLLGVLYGVYIVLSKPERLRELQLPGSSAAKSPAEGDAGPQIEFGQAGHEGHAHAEPHLAVETAAPQALGVELGSPASPAQPPLLAGSPASGSPLDNPRAGGGAGYGAPSYGQSTSSPSTPGPSTYGPSTYGQPAPGGVAASQPGTSAGNAAVGYGGGSRYSVTSATTGGLSDGGAASAYGADRSTVNPASGQDPVPGYGTSPNVQPAYETTPSTPSATAPDSGAAVQSAALTEYSLRQMWAGAEQLVAADKFKEALALLSSHYSHPGMPSEHREAMAPWLDALAARVIYSKQHLLEMPYQARAKETLFDIQERFNVPWQLLQNINSDVVSDPQVVVLGTPLKVMQGPFRADVELARGQLTVYLNDLYAGRFPFTVGNEPPRPGQYKVMDKRLDRAYYGAEGTIAAGDPTNPYGGVWMDLGREVSLHGSPDRAASSQALGCISLSPQDARDVYSILSLNSEVVIR